MTNGSIEELPPDLFDGEEMEPGLLLDLAPILPEPLLDLASEIAADIPDGPLRDRVWARLARRLLTLGREMEALEAMRAVQGWGPRAWIRLAGTLQELGRGIEDHAVALADSRAHDAWVGLAPRMQQLGREMEIPAAADMVKRRGYQAWAGLARELQKLEGRLEAAGRIDYEEWAWPALRLLKLGGSLEALAAMEAARVAPEPVPEMLRCAPDFLKAVETIEKALARSAMPDPWGGSALESIDDIPSYIAGAEIASPKGMQPAGTRKLLSGVPTEQQASVLEGALQALQQRMGAVPEERVVSTGFAPGSQPRKKLDPKTPLICNQDYYFWLEVGPPVKGSIEESPVDLPVEHLPETARLKVALFGFDGELAVTAGADVGEIELQPDGRVRVVRQPVDMAGKLEPGPGDVGRTIPEPAAEGGDLDLRPEDIMRFLHPSPADGDEPAEPQIDLLERRLFFPVHTPWEAGAYRLRCNIYHEQVLVQSRLVEARVVLESPFAEPTRTFQPDQPAGPALRSTLEYTLNHALQPQPLARLEPHRLSLLLNDGPNGTHNLHFFGQEEFKNSVTLDGQALGDLLEQARGALRRAAWGAEAPWDKKKYSYRYTKARSFKEFKIDLVQLAIRGYRFYDTLINQLAGGYNEAEALAALMRQPGLLQIAMKQSARYLLPAALIYDHRLDPDKYMDLDRYTLCEAFVSAYQGSDPLEQCACFQGECPSREKSDHVCPSGFWGYRHNLGMPLSVANAPDLPAEIGYRGNVQFDIGVSKDPGFVLRARHEQALQALHGSLAWNYSDSRDGVIELLKETQPHLVYFYCHGGMANNVPYLLLGRPGEGGLTRTSLRPNGIRWEETRPLVFINGCHTTALTPEVAMEFVSAFVENAAASAVIGTEITIFEPLACDFAEGFLQRFLDGAPLGEAIRGTRLALLKAGNPLGLVYIPFALASLRLVETN